MEKKIYDPSSWCFDPLFDIDQKNEKVDKTEEISTTSTFDDEDSLSRFDRCREELDKAIAFNEKQRNSKENI